MAFKTVFSFGVLGIELCVRVVACLSRGRRLFTAGRNLYDATTSVCVPWFYMGGLF